MFKEASGVTITKMAEVIIFGGALCLVVFLAAFSANKLALSVAGAMQGRSKGWVITGRVTTFTVSFITFLFAILLVFGLFFGR